MRMIIDGGQLPIDDFLRAVYATIRRVLQGYRWGTSFDENGFSLRQQMVSKFIRDALQWPILPTIPATQPTLSDVAILFPKNCSVPYDPIFRVPTKRAPVLALTSPPSTHAIDSADGPPMTRARSKALSLRRSLPTGSSSAAAPLAIASPLPWIPKAAPPKAPPPPRRVLPWLTTSTPSSGSRQGN